VTAAGTERAELPGLPRARIDPWLRRRFPALTRDGEWSAELISGGLSNITYRLHLSGGDVILRRPPLGGVLPSAHDMRREYRVIHALSGTDVPVPQALALESDEDVLGCPFYVMSDVPGEVLRTAADTGRLDVAARGRLAEEFVETLARLHAVDVDAVGLSDYGRGSGYAGRQVQRWGEQWQRSRQRDLPDLDRLLATLSDRVPPDRETTIVHGDYRVDNTVVDLGPSATAPRIVAVLDWELSTLGEPVADLALAMTYWHDRGDDERASIPVAVGVTAHAGFPTAAEVAQRYAARTGRDLDQLPFYLGLAGMKLAVILEGVVARHRGGHTVSGGYDRLGDAVPALVARGLRALSSG
jgi:aminoglycoside phosphotransferase (APT) family kinase protein